MVSENVEEYLECLWELTQDGTPARTSDIAKRMDVSPASVTEMMQRLDSQGYISYERYKGATLTEKGLRIGEAIKRKHRLLERFLVDVLGIEKERSHEEACRLEHALGAEALERLRAQYLAALSEVTPAASLRIEYSPFKQGGGRGDQLVRLMVDIPSGDTALEKALEGWTDTRP